MVTIDDTGWRRLIRQADTIVHRAARVAGQNRAARVAGGAASVVLTSDDRVRRLNARYRGRNTPTNVLTFEPGAEIILALGMVRREALAARRAPRHHLAHLVVHGVLHLRGHDHHHPGDARRMEMAETRIMHQLGLPNPWRRA